MAVEVQQTHGWWRRFSEYQIVNGYIRSHEDATISQYDPWEEYRASRIAPKTELQQPPYQEFLKLADELKAVRNESGEGWDLDAASESAVLRWYTAHGPLGIALSAARSIVVGPRRVDREWACRGPVFATYSPSGAGWKSMLYTVHGPQREVTREHQWEFAAGSPMHPAPNGFPTSHLIRFRSLIDTTLVQEPLDTWWSKHFTGIVGTDADTPATAPYWPPLSDEFWIEYQESVDEFLYAAQVFKTMADAIQPSPKSVDPDVTKGVGRDSLNHKGLSILEALLAPVHRTIAYVDGQRSTLSVAPSLLSSYAAMFCEDWVLRPPKRCEECNTIFVSNQPSVKYHSKRCLNTALKRTYRRNRRAKELKARGVPD